MSVVLVALLAFKATRVMLVPKDRRARRESRVKQDHKARRAKRVSVDRKASVANLVRKVIVANGVSEARRESLAMMEYKENRENRENGVSAANEAKPVRKDRVVSAANAVLRALTVVMVLHRASIRLQRPGR